MIVDLFNKPFVGAVVGDAHSGKSNMIYYIIDELQNSYSFSLYVYGLRNEIIGATEIHSIDELEKIKDSVIIIDEFFSLLDLEDRRKKMQVERTLRLLFHNNNIILLAGLPENFKKFISAKINIVFCKQVTLDDFINGSKMKRDILKYSGEERGSSVLNIPKNKCLVYDGNHYSKFDVPYIEKMDSKRNNVPIFLEKVPQNVHGSVTSDNTKNGKVSSSDIKKASQEGKE